MAAGLNVTRKTRKTRERRTDLGAHPTREKKGTRRCHFDAALSFVLFCPCWHFRWPARPPANPPAKKNRRQTGKPARQARRADGRSTTPTAPFATSPPARITR